jgi:hypothetical protein
MILGEPSHKTAPTFVEIAHATEIDTFVCMGLINASTRTADCAGSHLKSKPKKNGCLGCGSRSHKTLPISCLALITAQCSRLGLQNEIGRER